MRLFTSVVIAALGLQTVRADDPPANSAFPSEQHKKLDVLIGDWDVAVNHKAGDRYVEGSATCKAKWELDGMVMVQKYDSMINGKPFNVVQVLGYDVPKKKCFEINFQNLSPSVKHNEGDFADDGKTLTLKGEYADPTDGRAVKLRTIYTFTDPDHFTLEWFTTKSGGAEERGVTLKHSRKK